MYDDLVKRLRDAAKLIEALAVLLPHSEGSAVSKMYNEAADAIEELSKPRWIPVTERLPEDLTRVIVFCEDGVSYGLCEHLIADDEEVVEWHDFLHYPITPTHWMPLPEPPKEET